MRRKRESRFEAHKRKLEAILLWLNASNLRRSEIRLTGNFRLLAEFDRQQFAERQRVETRIWGH